MALLLTPFVNLLISGNGVSLLCNTCFATCVLRGTNTECCKFVDAGPALRVKHCLQMPVYPATLQHIPAPMQESVVLTFGRQLKTSLQNVHLKGYGHNDVKAANVFVSATGE